MEETAMGNMPFFGRSLSLALMLPALLAGCGGGSGTTPPLVSAATRAPSASTQGVVLDATADSATTVHMSWADSGTPGAGYRIYRDSELVDTVRDGSGAIRDTGLTPGTRYCYQLTAIDAASAGTADSNKSCVTTAALAGWEIQRISAAPPLSLALDARGLDRVSFCGSSGVYYQARQADGSISTAWLDPSAACFNALLAVGGDGSNHIVYADTNSDQLKYATDVSGQWVVSVIPGADGAEFPSLAIDQGNAVHVAYLVFTGHSPDAYQLAYATDASGSWQTTLVESVLAYPSIAVDAAGTPHIAYLGAVQSDGTYPVHYRSYVSAAWSDEMIATSDDPKTLVALAVTPAGQANLVYKSQVDLEYVTGISGHWLATRVDSFDTASPEYGQYGAYDVSIDLDTAGKPHLAYEDSSGNLKYAHLSSDRWATLYVDTEGAQNQLKVDAAGHAHITYAGVDNLYSKLAISP
jgi:hypothetical protein